MLSICILVLDLSPLGGSGFSFADSVLSGLTKCIHRLSKVREPPTAEAFDDEREMILSYR